MPTLPKRLRVEEKKRRKKSKTSKFHISEQDRKIMASGAGTHKPKKGKGSYNRRLNKKEIERL